MEPAEKLGAMDTRGHNRGEGFEDDTLHFSSELNSMNTGTSLRGGGLEEAATKEFKRVFKRDAFISIEIKPFGFF